MFLLLHDPYPGFHRRR